MTVTICMFHYLTVQYLACPSTRCTGLRQMLSHDEQSAFPVQPRHVCGSPARIPGTVTRDCSTVAEAMHEKEKRVYSPFNALTSNWVCMGTYCWVLHLCTKQLIMSPLQTAANILTTVYPDQYHAMYMTAYKYSMHITSKEAR